MVQRNPLAEAAISSVKFAKRRAENGSAGRKPMAETIIVDIDRTLTTEDSPKVALRALVGTERADAFFDSLLPLVIRGKLKVDGIHHAVFSELYSNGFKPGDWGELMSEAERTGTLRNSLINTLQRLAWSKGVNIVVATRSSISLAQWFANRYGFQGAVGSVEKVNGSFQGFDMRIGSYDSPGIMTKVSAAAKQISESGSRFDPERTVVLTNDLLDALEMLRCSRGVLLVPSQPNTLERLTLKLKLYDVAVSENHVPTIEKALLV